MNAELDSFDPSQFLDATTNEALVRRPPIPAGSVLPGIIEDLTVRPWKSNKPDSKFKAGIAFDFKLKLDTSSVADVIGGLNEVTMTAGVMVDTKEDGRSIDWGQGRNGGLRRWREALGMNNPGEAFSPRQMVGRQLLVKIKHRTYEGEFYDEVDSVAKIS